VVREHVAPGLLDGEVVERELDPGGTSTKDAHPAGPAGSTMRGSARSALRTGFERRDHATRTPARAPASSSSSAIAVAPLGAASTIASQQRLAAWARPRRV
jgi:hypothetical protein